ncbi:MAG: hypothetical protein QXZ43_00595 [Candidatus Aenigmatarchaeota archaeon]
MQKKKVSKEYKPTIYGDGYCLYINGIRVTFFVGQIKGLNINSQGQIIKTPYGYIKILDPALNAALKLRRGFSNGRIYGKDCYDIPALMTIGNPGKLVEYLEEYTCSACILGESFECIKKILQYSSNLPLEYEVGVQKLLEIKSKINCRVSS